ncbi:hypothetical protein I3259_05465, partial [Photobacterium sp. Ph5]|nr:hypothetical protein [Photobacterium sp. Ph6]MCG3875002.1 hypothetical protein [Photobacterium sp. Ph5]
MKKNIIMNTLVLLSLLGCGGGDNDISTTKNKDDISIDTVDDNVDTVDDNVDTVDDNVDTV